MRIHRSTGAVAELPARTRKRHKIAGSDFGRAGARGAGARTARVNPTRYDYGPRSTNAATGLPVGEALPKAQPNPTLLHLLH